MAEKKTSTSSPGPSSEGTLNVPSTPTITMGVEFEFLFGYLSLEEARKFDHADDDEDAGDDESVGGGDDDDKDDDEDSPTLGTATTPAEKKKAVVSAGEGSASFSSSARRGEIAAEADPWGDPSLAGQLSSLSLIQPAFLIPKANIGPRVVSHIFGKLKADFAGIGFRSRVHGLVRFGAGEGNQRDWWYQNTWTLKKDSSVFRNSFKGPWGVRHRFWGIEITSPVLDALNPQSFGHLSSAARVIKQKNRVSITRTCGFHVHVGLGPSTTTSNTLQNWDGLTIKKLVALVFLIDERLFALCRPYRTTSRFCMPISQQSRLANLDLSGVSSPASSLASSSASPPRASSAVSPPSPTSSSLDEFRMWMPFPPFSLPADDGMERQDDGQEQEQDPMERYTALMSYFFSLPTSTTEEMISLLSLVARVGRTGVLTSGGLSVSFRPLLGLLLNPGDKDSKPTVEFRLLEGTMNERTVVAWTQLCVRIVELAKMAPPEEFKTVLTGLVDGYIGGVKPQPRTPTPSPSASRSDTSGGGSDASSERTTPSSHSNDGSDNEKDQAENDDEEIKREAEKKRRAAAASEMLQILHGGCLTDEAIGHLQNKITGEPKHFTCCDHSDPAYHDVAAL